MKDQTSEGAWFGRWGVNYVYGTSGVLRALETVGLTARDYCQRAVAWLRSVQNSDGGFGESIASYYDPALKGKGSSTASQTAWGLIGLLAASEGGEDPSIARAVNHLARAATSATAHGPKDEHLRAENQYSLRCFKFEIPFVPQLFSVVRAGALPQHGRGSEPVRRIDAAAAGVRPAKFQESELRYPIKMTANLAKYVAGQRFRGTKKFPMVMMLEPLHACNLTCTGCGRIREYKSTINEDA